MSRKSLFLVFLLALAGCDQPKIGVAPPPDVAPSQTSGPPAFEIMPTVWGSADAGANYFVRVMENGEPGLYDADGRLLLGLMPELVTDLSHVGKRRAVPRTRAFKLIALQERPESGFTLLARIEGDEAQSYDLRIESGPNDPRIHLGLTTKWAADVELQREVLRFKTGPFAAAKGVQHDLTWGELTDEWTSSAHAPALVDFDGVLTVVGRQGVEGMVVRKAAEHWVVELEAYHFANHPIEVGDPCDVTLDGAGRFAKGDRTELRADFVVGELSMPVVARWPAGKSAAVALARTEPAAQVFRVAADADQPAWVEAPNTWLGPDPKKLPCEGGRFTQLAKRGVTSAFSGGELAAMNANVLAPTEADARRVLAFRQPGIPLTLFSMPDVPFDDAWLEAGSRTTLLAEHGLAIGLANKAKPETLAAVALTPELWFSGIADVVQRLVALGDVDVDLLPAGVVRIRNLGKTELPGLTLLMPEGVTARGPDDQPVVSDGRFVSFDLVADGEQLLQLSRADSRTPTVRGARITVERTPPPSRDEE